MGVTVTAKYKNAKSLDGGYFMFFRIRREIAYAWDAEFGEHYANLAMCHHEDEYKAFNKKTEQILKKERFKEADIDLVKFFFASDCGGKISYKTCGKIYNLIKDTTYDKALRYLAFSNNDWHDFKDLVKGCYSHRANLVWY